jgi:tryptophanyl-tRNA synthetase
MDIYGSLTGKTSEEIQQEFAGKGYGDFKLAVGETVADELAPLQTRYEELLKDKAYLEHCIKENDDKARYFAGKTLRKVQKKVGLTELIR